ncbi:unnamed protein product [Moneuplotes crassus]|uniref:Homeobox domain-containing protein n=1 Tax=Euplotes crassus TaxID=5936 RepID=A0AAD1XKU1_EUPCR|nr:unnamed protein product [Moneuplotes crassus]
MKRSANLSPFGNAPNGTSLVPSSERPLSEANTEAQIEGILKTCKNHHLDKDYNPEVKCARKKTASEIQFLEEMFKKDPKWGRKTVQICKKALDLNTDQIYKWGYDRKLLLRKKEKVRSDPLCNREIAMELKKEVFLVQDLNAYVSGLVSWHNSVGTTSSLNSLSLALREGDQAHVERLEITKISIAGKEIEMTQEFGKKLCNEDIHQDFPEHPSYPFEPFHVGSRSLFADLETQSRSNSSIYEKEFEVSGSHRFFKDRRPACDFSENDYSGSIFQNIPDLFNGAF